MLWILLQGELNFQDEDAFIQSSPSCCIFTIFMVFCFQDDVKGEEDMAAKKAVLLEKRMRREREARERKQQQELDQEQKKEAARLVSTPFGLV